MHKIHAISLISYSVSCNTQEELSGAIGNSKRMNEYYFLIQFLEQEYEYIMELMIMFGAERCGHISMS